MRRETLEKDLINVLEHINDKCDRNGAKTCAGCPFADIYCDSAPCGWSDKSIKALAEAVADALFDYRGDLADEYVDSK